MTPQMRAIAMAGGMALVVAAAVAYWLALGQRETSWPPEVRAAFVRSCVEKCRATPGVTEERYPLCDATCACAADEGQKIMTSDELANAGTAMSDGRATAGQLAKVERLKAAGQSCAARSATPNK